MANVQTTFSQRRTEDDSLSRELVPAALVEVTTTSNRYHTTVQEVSTTPEALNVGELSDSFTLYVQNLDDTNDLVLYAVGATDVPFAVIRPGDFCYVPLRSLSAGGSAIKAASSASTVRMLLVVNEIAS